MKSRPQSVSPQLNLALLDRALAELSQNEQQELTLALVELLRQRSRSKRGRAEADRRSE